MPRKTNWQRRESRAISRSKKRRKWRFLNRVLLGFAIDILILDWPTGFLYRIICTEFSLPSFFFMIPISISDSISGLHGGPRLDCWIVVLFTESKANGTKRTRSILDVTERKRKKKKTKQQLDIQRVETDWFLFPRFRPSFVSSRFSGALARKKNTQKNQQKKTRRRRRSICRRATSATPLASEIDVGRA